MTNEATLSVYLLGAHVAGSPYRGWKVLPGNFNFTKSALIEYNLKSSYVNNSFEWKRPRCYVGTICTLQLTLIDEYCNLLNHDSDVLKNEYINVNMLGPYNS